MLRWQLHEAHDKALRKVLGDLGFSDSQGRVRRFNGPKFWPQWVALGHTKTAFEDCECSIKARMIGPFGA